MARPAPTRTAPPAAAPRAASLVATVQFLVFEPGLYSVDVIADRSAPTDMGLALPCIRIEPVPPTGQRPGHARVVDPGESGWLWRRDEPAFVMVLGGSAGALVTIYRADDGMPSPEVRIRHVTTSVGAGPVPAPPTPPADGAVPLTLLAHVTQVGDLAGRDGIAGRPGSGAPIEGFQIAPGAPLGPDDMEYQAILGNNWNTPWFAAGAFCGSRGMMLPLLGIAIRLRGEAAAAYECSYSGRFVGGGTSGPCRDGEPCQSGGAALESFQVAVRPRDAEPPDDAVTS